MDASNQLRSAENAQFEIVGLDSRSVAYVDELSRHVVEVGARYLDARALQFPQRILISLKPEQYADFKGDYEIRVEDRGFVSLDIRWEESMTLRTVSRAIGEALLVRYSIFNYGPEGTRFLPDWPGTAIGTLAYLSLRPAEIGQLGYWMDLSVTPTLQSILDRKWSDAVVDSNAYCLLVGLERSGLERRVVRALMAQSIAGVDIREMLESSIQPDDPTDDPLSGEQWWAGVSYQLLSEETELLESMELSRGWIAQLSDMSEVGEELNLRSLWKQRDNEELRSLIEARYEILRIRMTRVNPAYFNSAQALGALFETFLYGERSHEYVHSLVIFMSEFEDMKRLETQVVRSL